MVTAKTSGALVLGVGVLSIVAVICLSVWVVLLVDTVNRESQTINRISGEISVLSSSLGTLTTTTSPYSARFFDGAGKVLERSAVLAVEKDWDRLADLIALTKESVTHWQTAHREGQSERHLHQLQNHTALQLGRIFEEASRVADTIRDDADELVSHSLIYIIALGFGVLVVMLSLAVFYYVGVIRPLEETTALIDENATTLEQIESRFLVRDLRIFAGRLFRAKLAAEASDRAKSTFLASMSHELRTPLNAIIGFTAIMRDGTFGRLQNERYQNYTADILDSAEHLLEVINDILDLSKVEAGRLDLNESEFDVVALVERGVDNQKPDWAGKRLSVQVTASPGLPLLNADKRLVRQSVGNLLSNAIKFTPEQGSVSLSCLLNEDGGVTLSVRDTGPGIDPDSIKRVSEPFYQVNRKLAVAQQGTGLGLALCKRFIELHGGGLSLSNRDGGGTEASLIFPPERSVFHGDDAPTPGQIA